MEGRALWPHLMLGKPRAKRHEMLSHPVLIDPRDVPFGLALGLDPSLGAEEVVDRVAEGRAEADGAARRTAQLLSRVARHFLFLTARDRYIWGRVV